MEMVKVFKYSKRTGIVLECKTIPAAKLNDEINDLMNQGFKQTERKTDIVLDNATSNFIYRIMFKN